MTTRRMIQVWCGLMLVSAIAAGRASEGLTAGAGALLLALGLSSALLVLARRNLGLGAPPDDASSAPVMLPIGGTARRPGPGMPGSR